MSQAPKPTEERNRPPVRRQRRSLFNSAVASVAFARKQAFITRSIIAIIFLVVLVVLSPSFFGWGLAVAAMITAVPISRLRAYAAAFLPYGAAWLVFTMLRALADETSVPLRTDGVTAIERAMFFGVTPTIWLQQHLFNPLELSWYDYATTFIHWSYFFVPHLMAVILWRRSEQLFLRYMVTTTLLLGVGLLVYFLAPAAPPWLTADTAAQEDIYRVMANVGREINSSFYNRTYSVVGDSNPVAAMPSMHMAITFMVSLFALRLGKWAAIAGMAYSALMAFSLVYGGEHYFIDVLVGSALATYTYIIAGHWLATVPPFFRSLFRQPQPVAQPVAQAAVQPVEPTPS